MSLALGTLFETDHKKWKNHIYLRLITGWVKTLAKLVVKTKGNKKKHRHHPHHKEFKYMKYHQLLLRVSMNYLCRHGQWAYKKKKKKKCYLNTSSAHGRTYNYHKAPCTEKHYNITIINSLRQLWNDYKRRSYIPKELKTNKRGWKKRTCYNKSSQAAWNSETAVDKIASVIIDNMPKENGLPDCAVVCSFKLLSLIADAPGWDQPDSDEESILWTLGSDCFIW